MKNADRQLSPAAQQFLDELAPTPERIAKIRRAVLIAAPVAAVLGAVYLPLGAIAILGVFFGILVLWSANMNVSTRRKEAICSLKKLESKGELDDAWTDYRTAGDFSGIWRVGQRYLFSLTTGLIIRYDEIRNVYQYVHRTNLIEDGRELRAVTASGETRCLTGLKRKGKSGELMQKAVAFLMIKNPSITVGYGQ